MICRLATAVFTSLLLQSVNCASAQGVVCNYGLYKDCTDLAGEVNEVAWELDMGQLKEARAMVRAIMRNSKAISAVSAQPLSNALAEEGLVGRYIEQLRLCAIEDPSCELRNVVNVAEERLSENLDACRRNYTGEK